MHLTKIGTRISSRQFKFPTQSTIVTYVGNVKQKQILSFHPCFAAKIRSFSGRNSLGSSPDKESEAIILLMPLAGSLSSLQASAELFPS
jgi:hypothetical protein